MSTASIGRPSCVRNSAFSVPSLALASRSKVSAESGTAAWSSARRSAGRFVISSYDDAPLATQRMIVLGKGGKTIKKIGTEARRDVERLLGTKIYLDLKIKVSPGWRSDRQF